MKIDLICRIKWKKTSTITYVQMKLQWKRAAKQNKVAVIDQTLLPNWTANNPETTNEEQQSSCQPMCLPKQLLQLPSCHKTTRTKLLPAWKPDVILKLLVLPLVYFCHFFRIFSQFLFFLITSFCHVLSLITIQSTFPPPPP